MARERRPSTTWTFRVDGIEYKVNVFLKKDAIQARCPKLDLTLEDTDLESLKGKCEEQISRRAKAVWRRFIHIQCSGYKGADWSQGYKLEVLYNYVEITDLSGKDRDPLQFLQQTTDRVTRAVEERQFRWRKLTERGEVLIEPFVETPVREGLPATGEPRSFMQLVLIPDTPEARQGLEKIAQAMQQLDGRLKTMLSPAQAQAFLTSIASGRPLLE